MKDTIKVTKIEKKESDVEVGCLGGYCNDSSTRLHYHKALIEVPVEVEETIDRPMTIAEAKIVWPLFLQTKSAEYHTQSIAKDKLQKLFGTKSLLMVDYATSEFTKFIDSLVDPESPKESV